MAQLLELSDAFSVTSFATGSERRSYGVVTVKGEVRTAAEKARVTDLVKATPGVKDAANALEIKPAKK